MVYSEVKEWWFGDYLFYFISTKTGVDWICVCVCMLACVHLFRAALEAYRGSQARGQIGAVAAGLGHSHSICNLHHSSQQRQSPNPQSKTRDQTRNLMVPSQVR